MLESADMKSGEHQVYNLILASNSPRRRELLSLGGWDYSLSPAQVDETPIPGESGVEYVQRLAKSKALAVADSAGSDGVILAADTSVIGSGKIGRLEIFGKPASSEDAIQMLHLLRGKVHQVFTAISIFSNSQGNWVTDLCVTDVPMRNYSDREIETYVASGDPMDKAGAYAIQHTGFHPVEKLEGCYANVMGLPMCHLKRSLHNIGIETQADVPTACQAALGYNCTVYPQIINNKVA